MLGAELLVKSCWLLVLGWMIGVERLVACSELVIGMGVATGRGEVEGETGGMVVAWCSTS